MTHAMADDPGLGWPGNQWRDKIGTGAQANSQAMPSPREGHLIEGKGQVSSASGSVTVRVWGGIKQSQYI